MANSYTQTPVLQKLPGRHVQNKGLLGSARGLCARHLLGQLAAPVSPRSYRMSIQQVEAEAPGVCQSDTWRGAISHQLSHPILTAKEPYDSTATCAALPPTAGSTLHARAPHIYKPPFSGLPSVSIAPTVLAVQGHSMQDSQAHIQVGHTLSAASFWASATATTEDTAETGVKCLWRDGAVE